MLNTPTHLNTIGDFILWGESQFSANQLYLGHGTDNAWDESLTLVLFALSLPWDTDNTILEQPVTMEQKAVITQLFSRRINEQMPAAYITGEAWFSGFRFEVDERVLVPRSPIAELIEVKFSPWLAVSPQTILDLCTGSGCIGIACAHYFPEASVTLSDISTDALKVAERNIHHHQLAHRVVAKHSDLFAGLGAEKYDLIVTNPPYVDANDIASMPPEYHHEPEIGLASGDDGLNFTRRLLLEAGEHLSEKGTLIVEVGNSGMALEEAFPRVPFMWLEFERGGHGVFVMTAEELLLYRDEFMTV